MRHVLWRSVWLLAVSAPACAATAPDTAATPVPTASPAPPAATTSSGPAAADQASGEIVVTALRTNQSAQKTPAAVTLVSSDIIQRQQIFDVRGLQNLVPSARFSANISSTRIYIRGVGSSLDFYWVPETTAVNLNGIYLPRFATAGSFFDLANVQVLPGPQGVLYGKSAGGGVVLITTNRPTFARSASGLIEYGNYNTLHAETAINTPFSSKLAVRLAAVVNRHDGYQSFGLEADNSFAVRGSVLWKPTDAASLLVWGTHFQQKGKPTAAQYIPYLPGGDPWFIPANDPVTRADNTNGAFTSFHYTIGGLEAKYDLGGATVELNGSILRQTEVSLVKLVGNDQTKDNAQTQRTAQLHIYGSFGGFDWIAGADYYLARSRYNVLFGPRKFGTIFPIVRNENVSGFGQVTYAILPALRVVGGARYNSDSLYLNGRSNACFAVCGGAPITFDKTWDHLDLKGGVEADLAWRVLAYANVQTGYAPGTLNTFSNPNLNKEVRPQTLLAYTAGVKSTVANGRVTLNVEGFHYGYRKLIIQAFNASIGMQSLYNVPNATVYGAQFTGVFRPSVNDTITANVAYTHSAYGAFVAGPGQRNLGGLQLSYTPTWTANLSYDRRFSLPRDNKLDARVSSYLSSSFWGTFDHSSNAFQDDYTRTDASLTFRPASDAWSAGLFVKNIGNEAVKTALTSAGYPPPYSGATGFEPPRTYGVSFGFKL